MIRDGDDEEIVEDAADDDKAIVEIPSVTTTNNCAFGSTKFPHPTTLELAVARQSSHLPTSYFYCPFDELLQWLSSTVPLLHSTDFDLIVMLEMRLRDGHTQSHTLARSHSL